MFSYIIFAIILAVSCVHCQFPEPCYTPENNYGVCISIYNCPSVLAQFQGPLTPETTNYLRSLQCSSDIGQYPHVCCTDQPRPPNRRMVFQPTRFFPQTPFNPGFSRNIGNGNILPAQGSCGLSALSQRIYGGEDAQLDDYPWMAILEYQTRNGRERKLSCGGSLINTRYVLTAAHCLTGEIETRVGELVGVRLGEYDTTKEIDCLGNECADPVVFMGIEEKIPHQRYNERSKNRANDIGLVRLNGEVTYTDYIKPICLPTIVNSQRSFSNEKVFSAGWGRTLNRRQSAIKQKIDLPIVDQRTCENKYSALGIFIDDNQLCAGGIYAQDTCDGDSGNPLMKIKSGSFVVEGLVSFGRGCGLQDWPAVYTRVSSYDRWIKSNLRP